MDIERILELRRQGNGWRQIGQAFDRSGELVRLVVDREYGLDKATLRTCRHCGRMFMLGDVVIPWNVGVAAQAAYCSPKCKKAAANQRLYKKRKKTGKAGNKYITVPQAVNLYGKQHKTWYDAFKKDFVQGVEEGGTLLLVWDEVKLYAESPPGFGWHKGGEYWRKSVGLSNNIPDGWDLILSFDSAADRKHLNYLVRAGKLEDIMIDGRRYVRVDQAAAALRNRSIEFHGEESPQKKGRKPKPSQRLAATAERYHALAQEKGIRWIGLEVPSRLDRKTRWRCGEGHEWGASFVTIKRSNRNGCFVCFNKVRARPSRPDSDYHELARQRGIEWLGPYTGNTGDRTRWRCEAGHEYATTYHTIQSSKGNGCQRCHLQTKHGESEYHALARHKGIAWLGKDVPERTSVHTLWRCEAGHEYAASYQNIRASKRTGCRQCFVASMKKVARVRSTE